MPEAPSQPVATAGAFVAVVGPSGAGKDTVLREASFRLANEPRVRFARRVVTRPAQVEAEDHDTLDEAAFAAAAADGAFCLAWRAHGLRYGLPVQHLDQARGGMTVVANVSRRALADAARVFGAIEVVEITADPRLLAARVAERGRESADAAAARLKRDVPLLLPNERCRLTRIDNSRALDEAVDRLVERLAAIVSTVGQGLEEHADAPTKPSDHHLRSVTVAGSRGER